MDFIIISYNQLQLLQNLYRQLRDMFRKPNIIIVDNASEQDVERWLRRLKAPTVIYNAENEGYAKACNKGAQAGSADLICFLNTDVILADGAIDAAASAFVDDSVVIAAPQQLKENGEPLLFDFGGGACLLVRRTWFDEIGGFDESYFFGGDDIDLSRRAVEMGYRWVTTEPAITHLAHRSHTEETQAHIDAGKARLAETWGEVALKYVGDGFVIGVPARDLSREDLIRLQARGFERQALLDSHIYKEV